jgi:flagellar FliL protein
MGYTETPREQGDGMADEEATDTVEEEGPPKKASKLPMIIGLVLALAGGGGGFYAVQSGLILGADHGEEEMMSEEPDVPELEAAAFVALDPFVISLSNNSRRQYLRFRATLEVPPAYEADVEAVLPRVADVLNGYLRAVEVAEMEDPAALSRLRAQMLRRVQIVVGEGRVRDLLILEFVLD